MVATGSILYGKCFHQLEFNNEEHPVAVQLGGSDTNHLIESSKICEEYGYDEINLNVGCPSDRVQKGRFGACLMLEPNHVAECLGAMKNNVSIPVSIKCRLGIDHHEDYELLFTISQEDYPKIKANPNMTVIGHILKPTEGTHLITRGNTKIPLIARGWSATQENE